MTRSDGVYSITSGCPVLGSQSQNRQYTPKQNRETRVLEGSLTKGSPPRETKKIQESHSISRLGCWKVTMEL